MPIVSILQYVAVISVSASAALLAIKKRMDIVGSIVVAMIASFGGGVMRDLLIGNIPVSFLEPSSTSLILCSFGVVFILFHIGFIPKAREGLMKRTREFWFDLTDAVGLAAFAVAGADVTRAMGENAAVQIFCGCITGVGGGILRDVVAAEIPLIFRKRIYLLPVIFGTAAYVWLQSAVSVAVAVSVGMAIIVGFRILAILYKWDLPTPLPREKRKEDEEKKEKQTV